MCVCVCEKLLASIEESVRSTNITVTPGITLCFGMLSKMLVLFFSALRAIFTLEIFSMAEVVVRN